MAFNNTHQKVPHISALIPCNDNLKENTEPSEEDIIDIILVVPHSTNAYPVLTKSLEISSISCLLKQLSLEGYDHQRDMKDIAKIVIPRTKTPLKATRLKEELRKLWVKWFAPESVKNKLYVEGVMYARRERLVSKPVEHNLPSSGLE